MLQYKRNIQFRLQWHSNPWLLRHRGKQRENYYHTNWRMMMFINCRHMYMYCTCWHPRLWTCYPWNRKQGSPHTSARSSPTPHGCGQWRSEHTPLWRNPRSSLSHLRMMWPDERLCGIHVKNSLSWSINLQFSKLIKIQVPARALQDSTVGSKRNRVL